MNIIQRTRRKKVITTIKQLKNNNFLEHLKRVHSYYERGNFQQLIGQATWIMKKMTQIRKKSSELSRNHRLLVTL
jgi:hypothetical protein